MRLKTKGMHIVEIPQDGNCYFSCFALFKYGSTEHHEYVRKGMVDYILENWKMKISNKFNRAYKAYFKKFGIVKTQFKAIYTKTNSTSGKNEHWGGSNFYNAACNLYNINLIVITETEDNNFGKSEVIGNKYTPIEGEMPQTCFIMFRNGNHFDYVRTEAK